MKTNWAGQSVPEFHGLPGLGASNHGAGRDLFLIFTFVFLFLVTHFQERSFVLPGRKFSYLMYFFLATQCVYFYIKFLVCHLMLQERIDKGCGVFTFFF